MATTQNSIYGGFFRGGLNETGGKKSKAKPKSKGKKNPKTR